MLNHNTHVNIGIERTTRTRVHSLRLTPRAARAFMQLAHIGEAMEWILTNIDGYPEKVVGFGQGIGLDGY